MNEAQFQLLVRLPKFSIGDLDHAAPEIRLGQMLFPIAQILRVERGKFRCHPGLGMNAIGDAGDRHLMSWNARPDIFPKRLTDFPVELAHSVGVAAHAQREDGHAKAGHRSSRRLAKAEQLVERDLELGREVREVAHHHLAREGVVPGRNRSVGGENIRGRHDLESGIEIELVLGHVEPDALERKEGGVAFVHVKDFRFMAERAEGFDAADAEHDLLAHPHLEITAV